MSRRWRAGALSLTSLVVPLPLAAQDAAPPDRIDILVQPQDTQGPLEDCSDEQEAATISGEIVVCRKLPDGNRFGYDSKEAEKRYAEATMNKGDPRAPDVAGAGIFRGPATVGGLCGLGFNPCPPPPAYIVDFDALPDAPPGSDADRIARGLPPLGRDGARARAGRKDELGLPPVPDAAPVIPSGSASPEEGPSD